MVSDRTHLVCVRFDRINRLSSREADTSGFAIRWLPAVPAVGEIVNIDGNPYLVHERGWAVGEMDDEQRSLYAYLRMLPAFKEQP